MTPIVDQNSTEATNLQQKVDTNLSQTQVDANLSQKKDGVTQEKAPESVEDPNFVAFREARKKDKEKRQEAERKAAEKELEIQALKAAMEAAFSKSAPSPQAYQQYYGIQDTSSDTEESEDQRIEKKVNALLEAKEQKYRQEQAKREQQEYPDRLIRNFPDFNQVIAQENLDYIDYHYPEVSRPLQRLQDGYDKWSDIYHAIKKFVPNHSTFKKDSLRAESNQNKPKSISSTSVTPPGEPEQQSWQEIERRRAENWARMQRTLKGV